MTIFSFTVLVVVLADAVFHDSSLNLGILYACQLLSVHNNLGKIGKIMRHPRPRRTAAAAIADLFVVNGGLQQWKKSTT